MAFRRILCGGSSTWGQHWSRSRHRITDWALSKISNQYAFSLDGVRDRIGGGSSIFTFSGKNNADIRREWENPESLMNIFESVSATRETVTIVHQNDKLESGKPQVVTAAHFITRLDYSGYYENATEAAAEKINKAATADYSDNLFFTLDKDVLQSKTDSNDIIPIVKLVKLKLNKLVIEHDLVRLEIDDNLSQGGMCKDGLCCFPFFFCFRICGLCFSFFFSVFVFIVCVYMCVTELIGADIDIARSEHVTLNPHLMPKQIDMIDGMQGMIMGAYGRDIPVVFDGAESRAYGGEVFVWKAADVWWLVRRGDSGGPCVALIDPFDGESVRTVYGQVRSGGVLFSSLAETGTLSQIQLLLGYDSPTEVFAPPTPVLPQMSDFMSNKFDTGKVMLNKLVPEYMKQHSHYELVSRRKLMIEFLSLPQKYLHQQDRILLGNGAHAVSRPSQPMFGLVEHYGTTVPDEMTQIKQELAKYYNAIGVYLDKFVSESEKAAVQKLDVKVKALYENGSIVDTAQDLEKLVQDSEIRKDDLLARILSKVERPGK